MKNEWQKNVFIFSITHNGTSKIQFNSEAILML